MEITLFTINLHFFDDTFEKTIDYPLHQLCLQSWNKIICYAEKLKYTVNVKIFTEKSEEYEYVYESVIKKNNITNKARQTDVFRLYILAHNPNYMWLDWDVYIRDNFEFDFTKPFLMRNWFLIFNSVNLDLFQELYSTYCKYDIIRFGDKEATIYMEEEGLFTYLYNKGLGDKIIHCSFIDNQPVETLYFINTDEENDNFVISHKKDKRKFRFININSGQHKCIKGLFGEPELINFILNNYILSDKQKNSILKEVKENDR